MRKIGIVGNDIYQEELQDRAKDYDLWSVNNLYLQWPDVKFARWYELHTIEKAKGEFTRRGFDHYPIHSEITVTQYIQELNNLGIPVYMQKRWPKDVKMSEVFPFDSIMKQYGSYMGCSFTWMVAQALAEGVDTLGFFGVNFSLQEYYYQRPSLERMIGIAQGRNIAIYIDQTSNLLKSEYVYAIGENFDLTYLLHGEFVRDLTEMFVAGISDRLAQAVMHPEGRK